MSISSKITVTWTPSANAQSQDIQRSTDTVNWTTLSPPPAATASTYTDETTVDFTQYYYRIVTYCSGGITKYTNPIQQYAANCPTMGENTIFGLKSTNGGLSVSFQYYDRDAELAGFTAVKTVSASPLKTRIVCHKCGQTVQPAGTFASFGDVSYMSNQNNIGQYLPTAAIGGTANGSRGTVYRQLIMNSTVIVTNTKNAYLGTKSGNVFVPSGVTTGSYNLKNWTAVLIGKKVWTINNTGADQLTELNSLNPTNLYVAILVVGNFKCEVYIYQATRNSAMDTQYQGSPMQLGFDLTYVSSITNGNYQIYSTLDTYSYTWSTQPHVYFKFFNL